MEHCANYDQNYEGCRDCPGKLSVIRQDGTVETICRAGTAKVRNLIAAVDNNLPVYALRFPGTHDEPRNPA